ncbi:MAG TPA: hypothetical protein VFM54_23140 [Micromonosporaceae bacterium]|nr:hypothetical protein [Micromonosporaceae bacterium]
MSRHVPVPRRPIEEELSAAFERYLATDEEHRRAPAEEFLSLPQAQDYILEKLCGLPVSASRARAALWRLAGIDAIGKLAHPDDRWIATLVLWLGRGQATWQESASVCAEVGFQAYLADKPNPITTEMIRSRGPLTVAGRALLHLHLIAQRLAYRWEAMEQCFADLDTPVDDLDPYARAYHVFALLAGDDPSGPDHMRRLLEVAGDDYRVNLSLVEGLRLSRGLPNQGERMLQLLARPALALSPSPDPLYRKAYALRKLGRYNDALRVADECLQKIPPLQVQDRIRILQERELILAEQAIDEQAAAARQAAQDQLSAARRALEALVAAQMAEMRRTMSESLFRTVEILGVFTAIVAILGGSAISATAAGMSWWQRGVLIIVAGAVGLGFFALLRIIVQPRVTDRSSTPKGER